VVGSAGGKQTEGRSTKITLNCAPHCKFQSKAEEQRVNLQQSNCNLKSELPVADDRAFGARRMNSLPLPVTRRWLRTSRLEEKEWFCTRYASLGQYCSNFV
jgi:hypothetical protein